MTRIVQILAGLAALAGLLAAVLPPASALGETGARCAVLAERVARQAAIAGAYGCRAPSALEAEWFATQAGGRARCATDPAAFARRVAARARALEDCLFTGLAADANTTSPAVSQWSQPAPRGAPAAPRTLSAGTSDSAPGALQPAGSGPLAPAPLAGGGARGPSAGQAESARRVRELLAAAPSPKPGAEPVSARAAREFRAGLVWSYAGPLDAMHCVQWNEPSDPHDWQDNYLCTERDVDLSWSFRGPVQGRGLRCIQVNEPADPHMWHDNYFCWPRDLPVTFRFSNGGRIAGMHCVAIVEPSDPHTWRDNFLCYREDPE